MILGMKSKTATRTQPGAPRAQYQTFDIRPLGDYSLEESASFIGAWHKAPEDGEGAPGHLHLAFLTDGDWEPVGVCLNQSADGAVHGEIFGSAETGAVKHQVERILSLDVDGRAWPEVGRREPVVGRLQAMFPGFRPVNWSDAYEAAAWCLMSTRITMRQGQAVKDRMCRELGHEVDVHGHRMWVFPEPARLERLESFPGLFGRKVEYLSKLARAALAGDLDTDELRALPREGALERLKRLAGIGEFGSQLIRLRALSAVDEIPTHEPRLLEAVRLAYGRDLRALRAPGGLAKAPDVQRLQELAEGWRPFRMWVCVCLRRTLAGGAGMTHSRASG
jgi:DNA-3-methyladenine glycosylase II